MVKTSMVRAAFLMLWLLLLSGPAVAETSEFPGYRLDLPGGWTVVSAEEMGDIGDFLYIVTLKSDDGGTELVGWQWPFVPNTRTSRPPSRICPE